MRVNHSEVVITSNLPLFYLHDMVSHDKWDNKM